MECPKCDCEGKKHGKTRDGQQRFRCRACGTTFSEPKPLAGKITDIDTATRALAMLLEGMSVRATSRLTGLDKNTILRLMVQAGEQCDLFLAATLVGLPALEVQCDEQWAFVYMKERTSWFTGGTPDVGDCYVFTAIDRATKLLLTFHVGKRTPDDTPGARANHTRGGRV